MRRRRPLCGCAGQGVTTDCAQSVQQGPRRRCWGADLSETGWLQGGGTLQLGEIMFVSSPLVGGDLLPDGPLDACGLPELALEDAQWASHIQVHNSARSRLFPAVSHPRLCFRT